MDRERSPWSGSSDDDLYTGLRPPQNDEAERSALGCALLSEEALELMMAQLDDDDFYNPSHRVISAAMRHLALNSKPVDTLTLAEELERRKKLDEIGGRSYIFELTSSTPVLSNAIHYYSLVRQKSLLRQIILTLDEVKGEAYGSEDASRILDLAAAKLFDLKLEDGTIGPQSLTKVLGQVINEIHDLQRGDLDGLRVKTGYPSLDKLLGGLKTGTLNIVAARPAMGKSALAINIAHKVSVYQNKPTAVFSLEMSRSEIGIRIMSAESLIDSYKLSTGDFQAEAWSDITRALAPLYTSPLFIDDRAGASPLSILSECRRLKLEHGLALVIIDYLQLMSPDGRHESRQQEISEISRNLKLLAKELDVPVLALSQLSRAVEQRQNKRPTLSDLRDSGSIEQDADTVLFIYRDSYYQETPESSRETAEIIVAKNRGGSTGTINLTWIPKNTLFVDESYREAPPERMTSGVPDPPEDFAMDSLPFDPTDDGPDMNSYAEILPADDSDLVAIDESSLPYE